MTFEAGTTSTLPAHQASGSRTSKKGCVALLTEARGGVPIPPLQILELCAGAGMLGVGLKLGLAALGRDGRVVCYVERDAFAASALVARMEDAALDPAPVCDDLLTFDGRGWRGRVQVITAGIPCQGNSTAGRRRLGKDPRNLWPATRRVLREVEPDFFLLENVAGFLIPNRRVRLEAPVARVLGELAEDGWDAEWDVVPAAEVGASHRRERVFILARNAKLADAGRRQLPLSVRAAEVRAGAGPHGRCNDDAAAVADAGRNERHGRREGDAVAQPASERTAVDADPRVGPLADVGRGGGGGVGLFAPGPSDFDAWAAALRLDPALAPATQPEVRGVADGLAQGLDLPRTTRPDELRLVGNGVVPLAAAIAVVQLLSRFADPAPDRPARPYVRHRRLASTPTPPPRPARRRR